MPQDCRQKNLLTVALKAPRQVFKSKEDPSLALEAESSNNDLNWRVAHAKYTSGANKLKIDEKELRYTNNEDSHRHLEEITTNPEMKRVVFA